MTPWKDTGLTPKGSRINLGYGSPRENINRQKTLMPHMAAHGGGDSSLRYKTKKQRNGKSKDNSTTATRLRKCAKA